MAKILVVAYSRTGSTTRVGKELAIYLDADFERIEEVDSRRGAMGFVVSVLESVAKGLPAIRTHKDPSQYDLLVLGSPVWVGNMASPVRSYLTLHRAQLPRMAFFATMRARGGEEAVREMKFFARADAAPSCVFTQSDIEQLRHSKRLEEFAKSLTFLSRQMSAPLSPAADASTWIGEPERA